MKRLALLWLSLSILSGCRCRETVDPTQIGFRSETTELDYGRVLEGDTRSLDVSLVSIGRSNIEVAVETDLPFSAVATVTVPGGASASFPVVFTAGNGPVTGEARLTANGGTVRVKLKGVGVRPKTCVPSAPCRQSTYSLELDQCVETPSADGASCQPESICLEKGECRSGVCQGTARGCDDKDACTVDSCAMDVGCIHVPRVCPVPTAACRVATCDSVTGCGEAVASDGTPCGGIDCVNAHLCVAGICGTVATPEGFLCAPATPCQGESHCHNQACVAPEAMVMAPKTVVRLPGTPVDERPSLLAHAGNVFFQQCALQPAPDAGPVDAGSTDGGADGGEDAGEFDAGVDYGVDGGYCGLTSYTGSGFERWTARYPDSLPRSLTQASPRGVVLLQPGALELRSIPIGAPVRFPFEGEVVPRGIAQSANLELWAVVTSDGGSRLIHWATDGGAQPEVPLDAGVCLLAVDEAGGAWVYSPDGGALGLVQLSDAGWTTSWQAASPGGGSLVVASGSVFAGGQTLFNGLDGGLTTFTWLSDAGFPIPVLERPVVASEGAGVAFYRECVFPLMSCSEPAKATWMQVFSLDDGKFLWRAKVLDEGAPLPGRVEEVALTGFAPGAMAVVVQLHLDGGTQAALQGYLDGKRVLNCPFSEGTTLGGAVFSGANLHLLVTRDAGWLLETYDLGALPISGTGWPQADGVSGTRRAR